MAVAQVAVAALEVAATAAIAYALLPHGIRLGFPAFLAIYIAAYSAGLAAGVPGGLGVFDGALVLGLSPFLPAAQAIGVIVVFRLFYYIVPLFLAGLLFAGHELVLRGDVLLAHRRGLDRPVRVRPSVVIRESEADFAVTVAVGAVMLCGAMLLAIGLIDDTPDLRFALPPAVGPFGGEGAGGGGGGLARFLLAAGDYIPSLLGATLMGLAIGLSRRVTLAWGATLGLLCLAAALTALRGPSLAVPGVLILSALVIAPFRSSYYRHARLLSEPLAPSTVVPLLLLLGCVLFLAHLEPELGRLDDTGWPALVLAATGLTDRTRASVALSVLVGLLAIARLILPGRICPLPWSEATRARCRALGRILPEENGPGNGLGDSPVPGDPDGVMLGETGRAMLPFRRIGRLLAGLGDPAGPVSDQVSTIWRLRDLAVQEGREPIFWRVGPTLLDVYADLGLEAWPLEGTPRSYLCCPAERGPTLLSQLAGRPDPLG